MEHRGASEEDNGFRAGVEQGVDVELDVAPHGEFLRSGRNRGVCVCVEREHIV